MYFRSRVSLSTTFALGRTCRCDSAVYRFSLQRGRRARKHLLPLSTISVYCCFSPTFYLFWIRFIPSPLVRFSSKVTFAACSGNVWGTLCNTTWNALVHFWRQNWRRKKNRYKKWQTNFIYFKSRVSLSTTFSLGGSCRCISAVYGFSPKRGRIARKHLLLSSIISVFAIRTWSKCDCFHITHGRPKTGEQTTWELPRGAGNTGWTWAFQSR